MHRKLDERPDIGIHPAKCSHCHFDQQSMHQGTDQLNQTRVHSSPNVEYSFVNQTGSLV